MIINIWHEFNPLRRQINKLTHLLPFVPLFHFRHTNCVILLPTLSTGNHSPSDFHFLQFNGAPVAWREPWENSPTATITHPHIFTNYSLDDSFGSHTESSESSPPSIPPRSPLWSGGVPCWRIAPIYSNYHVNVTVALVLKFELGPVLKSAG